MTPLRKYGTSLLDQEIGIGAQRERDRRDAQARSEGLLAKADASDFRRARRAYRRAMRNEDTGMAAMALRGMEAFGSAKSAATGIQSAGWADRVGESNVTRYEYNTGQKQSFAQRADFDKDGNGIPDMIQRPQEPDISIPDYSGKSLQERRGLASDLLNEAHTAVTMTGGYNKESFLKRAEALGLGRGTAVNGRSLENLWDSALSRYQQKIEGGPRPPGSTPAPPPSLTREERLLRRGTINPNSRFA